MPRGKKGSTDYDAEIEKVESKIAKYTQLLSELKAQLQELQSKKRDVALQKIYTFMADNDMTPEQVIDRLQVSTDAIAASTDPNQEIV